MPKTASGNCMGDGRGGSLPGSHNMMGKVLMELRSKVKAKNKVIPLAMEGEENEEDILTPNFASVIIH